jgi:hypothetical protein
MLLLVLIGLMEIQYRIVENISELQDTTISYPIETKDINNNFAASKMATNKTKLCFRRC